MTKNEQRLLKELKAMRLVIQKMKASCNKYDEAFSLGEAALTRVNKTIKEFRLPVALSLPK